MFLERTKIEFMITDYGHIPIQCSWNKIVQETLSILQIEAE